MELFVGFDDGTFRPDETISRAQFSSVLDRALASAGIELADVAPSFTDVSGTHSAAIGRLAAVGIINGVTETTFAPDGTITRGQSMALLERAGDAFGVPFPPGGAIFPDTLGTEHEAAIARARVAGIALGYPDGSFGPGDAIRRDQAASLMGRWLAWNTAAEG